MKIVALSSEVVEKQEQEANKEIIGRYELTLDVDRIGG
jgi:hypothetical protein